MSDRENSTQHNANAAHNDICDTQEGVLAPNDGFGRNNDGFGALILGDREF